jgi:uncharacterized protein YkwD
MTNLPPKYLGKTQQTATIASVPLKTHKKHFSNKKHPKHYAKVYWPYIPLILILLAGLFVGQSSVSRSQRGVLAYATHVSNSSLLDSTNQQRAANGDKTLSMNDQLAKAAQAKAEDMAKRNYWSHNTPDGKEPWIFIDQTNYAYQKAGENLAYGFISSGEAVAGWMNSPSHRENMLDPSYSEVGFGVANANNYQNNGPETIIVAMYGQPLHASNGLPVTAAAGEQKPVDATPVTSATPTVKEPEVKSINKAQALTGGHLPWINFGLGLISGGAIVFLILKHGLALRKALRSSERFMLHHPLLDLTILSLVALCALLSQSVGLIR